MEEVESQCDGVISIILIVIILLLIV